VIAGFWISYETATHIMYIILLEAVTKSIEKEKHLVKNIKSRILPLKFKSYSIHLGK
jgi:hypothetical protein